MQFWVTDGKDITRKEAETLVSPWDVCLEEWSWCHRYPCMFSEEEGSVDLEGRCERSRGGMRQRGYQFVEGSLCPISSVRGHVPRVLTLVTSLASSLPGDPGPGVFITYLHPYPHKHTHTYAQPPKHNSPHGGKQITLCHSSTWVCKFTSIPLYMMIYVFICIYTN